MSIYNQKCRKCFLWENALTVCMPAQSWDQTVLFPQALIIGEAPGRNEDETGSPFVGQAGTFLASAIRSAGRSRADVRITNVVKCRPPGNRAPKQEEIDACKEYLDAEFKAFRTTHILALGLQAAQALVEINESMTRMRGLWFTGFERRFILPTWHPAYALRQGTLSKTAEEFRRDVAGFFDVVSRV